MSACGGELGLVDQGWMFLDGRRRSREREEREGAFCAVFWCVPAERWGGDDNNI